MRSSNTTFIVQGDYNDHGYQYNIQGMGPGCPLSMILYTYYNANLIDIARGKHELSTGFVDNCGFVATADTLDKTHSILKNMMERANGGLEWSLFHNSPFELLKLAVMDFPRMSRDTASSPLHINKMDPQGIVTPYTISKVDTYKYLGVTFDLKLNWRPHTNRVTTKAIRWTQQLWKLAKTTGGLPPARAWQFYNTAAVPALTYASDIQYLPPFKLAHSKNSQGSIAITKKLHAIQGHATRFIMGGLKGTAFDVLEAHANTLLIDLLFHKTQLNTATCICALPNNHPLSPIV